MDIRNGNEGLFLGRVLKDPEYRKTPSGKDLVSFALGYGEGQGTIISVKCWEKMAGKAQYLKKGSTVGVFGKVSSRDYNGRTYYDLNCALLLYNTDFECDDSGISVNGVAFSDVKTDDIPF